MTRIAIIGAGLSGLVVARSLEAGHDVTVFEKSRGVGGRMATRSAGDWQFDHGAQFFTAKTRDFERFLSPFIEAGVVNSWNATFAEHDHDRILATRAWSDSYPHYVATPGMNALGKSLASGLDVRTETAVAGMRRRDSRWALLGADGRTLGNFDWVICTAPAAQSAALMPPDSALGQRAAGVRMLGCFALMLGFAKPLPLEWQASLVRNSRISWVSVDSSKPGRKSKFSVVVHSTNAWAEQNMDEDPGSVEKRLLLSASAVLGVDCADADLVRLHRWRYANIPPQERTKQVDADRRLAACGDWFVRGRIEAAYTSAVRLVQELGQLI